MFLRSPRSTLFPYTTLFRSSVHHLAVLLRWKGSLPEAELVARRALSLLERGPEDAHLADSLNGLGNVLQDEGDRKSTRLNSSHLGISYAVFCLKKKKRSRIDQPATEARRGTATQVAQARRRRAGGGSRTLTNGGGRRHRPSDARETETARRDTC